MMDVPCSSSSVPCGRRRYWREISAVLALKTLGFALIYLLCFGPWNSLQPDTATIARHLISPAAGSGSGTIHD